MQKQITPNQYRISCAANNINCSILKMLFLKCNSWLDMPLFIFIQLY